MTVSSKLATVGMKGLAIAGNMIAFYGITLVIQTAAKAIYEFATAQQKAIDKNNELISAWKEQSESLRNNQKSISSIKDEYSKLSDGVDQFGNNISLTSEEYEKYNNISKQIADMFPTLIQYHTDISGGITAEKISVDELTGAYENLRKEYNNKTLTEAAEVMKNFYKITQGVNDGKMLLGQGGYSLESQRDAVGKLIEDFDKLQNLSHADTRFEILKDGLFDDQVFEIFKKSGITDFQGLITQDLSKAFSNPENITKLTSYLDILNGQLESYVNSDLKPITEVLLFGNDSKLSKLNSDVQNSIRSIVSNFGFDFYKQFDGSEVALNTWLQTNIIKPLINPKTGKEVQNAISKLFSLKDNKDISAGEWEKQVAELLKIIKDTLGEDSYNVLIKLGFDTSNLDTEINGIVNKFHNTENDVVNSLKTMSKGNVDLLERPVINTLELIKKGWDNVGEGIATVYSCAFSNKDETKTVVVTPILPNGEVLSPEELEKYAQDILNGKIDNKNINLGLFDGEKSIEEAEDFAQKLHYVQDRYYSDITKETISDLTPEQIHFVYSYDNIGDKSLEEILNEHEKVKENSFDLFDISDNLSSFNTKIEELYNSYDLLAKAFDEFEEQGIITSSTFKSLSDNNLLQYLDFSSGKLKILSDELYKNEEALKTKAVADLKSSLYSDLHTLAVEGVTDAELEAEKQSANTGEAIETMSTKFANSAPNIMSAATAIDIYNKVSGSEGTLKGKEKQINDIIDLYNKTVTSINSIGSAARKTSKAFGGLGKSAKKAGNEAKKAMQDAQSSINNLLKMTMTMLRKGYENDKKALQDRINQLKKNEEASKKSTQSELDDINAKIQAQLNLLKIEKEKHDYENGLTDKRNDVNVINNELDKLQFDDSAESQKRKLELHEQLSEKQKELDEYQYDNSIKLQEDALNKEKKNVDEIYKSKLESIEEERKAETESLEKQIKNIDKYVSKEVNIRTEAINLIEGKSNEFYNRLIQWNYVYGDGLSTTVSQAWDSCYSAMDIYNKGQYDVISTLELLASKLADVADKAKKLGGSISNNINNTIDKINELSHIQLPDNDKGKFPAQYYYDYKATGKWYDTDKPFKFEIPKRHDGGFVKQTNVPNNLKKLFNLANNESLYKLLPNELVLTQLQQKNLINKLTLPQIPNLNNQFSSVTPNIQMGDIIIQGNADDKAINNLKSIQSSIVDDVFRRLNKHR